MDRRVIAVLDWRSASVLKDNARLLERAGIDVRAGLRGRSARFAKGRSLTLRGDGSCEVQECSTAAVLRRLDGVVVRRATRKTRKGQSG